MMGDSGSEPLLLRRYRAWLPGYQEDGEREAFFTQGLIVLDTNVLLDLYRYTQPARTQVLAALRLVADRQGLWLPYQVGLEFIRNREQAVKNRVDALAGARNQVKERFRAAVREVIEAREKVAQLLRELGHDESASAGLAHTVTPEGVRAALEGWEKELLQRVEQLKQAQDLTLQSLRTGDPLLPEIAGLFGDRIGEPLPAETVRELVHHAVEYRFPNRIPPGFKDTGKGTKLLQAGDYLVWEEIVRHAATLPEPRRVLLVTRDTKQDWYEQDAQSGRIRPLPALIDEMWARARARLRIETPQDFYRGTQEFLGAELTEDTYGQVAQVAEEEPAEPDEFFEIITDNNAGHADPGELFAEACTKAVLGPQTRQAGQLNRHFAWWLVGVTADLGLRTRKYWEPAVRLATVALGPNPPAPNWSRGRVPFRQGTIAVWLAPWLARALEEADPDDVARINNLIGRQLELESEY
ncbi:hypothetical protein C3Y87_08090 [Carbonactinospora thermoautotrophica]|uniref:PIN-like domain-containing protein n=1 Tax=Carbonactinospora thermoautotrophica TaxID=1469144 RepID=UPI002272257F|nr:PIN-like domain-containing protein [Carbonactinospora thermoautotrophica]MCX9191373.1 hypothetical protein [Carbonactinospora thermoautotrophica]